MTDQPMTLRQHRVLRALTMLDLSKLAGVATATIVKIERGDTVRPSVYKKIAKALEIQPTEIREFVDLVKQSA